MAEQGRSRTIKVEKSELLCKSGCGFFGNPAWSGLCSKCWREHNTKQEAHNFDSLVNSLGLGGSTQSLPAPLNKERPSPFSLMRKGPASPSKAATLGRDSLSSQLSRFEDKKRKHVQTLERKTSNMKQMFKKGKDELAKARSPTRADRPALPPEAKAISGQFAEFLKTRVKSVGITDLSRNIQSFIDKVHKRVESLPIEQVSVMVQNFYQALARRLETHENFVGLTEEERGRISDLTERYIMICCWKPLFCPYTTTDEEEDLEIQAKIRSLNWVTAGHLDCPFKETKPEVRDVIYTAINDILELDGSRCPQDKLASVVTCSKAVFAVLQAGGTEQASADDFLPALIYILLKANPPRIWSNINFITRFSNESRLRSGEEGYYFTNLCCSLEFIKNLSANSLNLPQAEFDSYMSGQAIPPGSWEAGLLMCEGIQAMGHNLRSLGDLADRQERLQQDCAALEREMAEFQVSLGEEVAGVLARTTFTLRGPRRPAVLDGPGGEEEALLPPPLLPTTSPTPPTLPVSSTPPILTTSPTPSSTSPFTPDPKKGAPCLPTAGAPLPSSPLLPTAGVPLPSSPLAAYVGFSAQASAIPSISCSTAATDRLLASPASFTPSSTSSSLHSPDSPEGRGEGD